MTIEKSLDGIVHSLEEIAKEYGRPLPEKKYEFSNAVGRIDYIWRLIDIVKNDMSGTSIPFHICTSSEYDTTTHMPTVSDPDDGTIYMVPASVTETGNLFDEWVYVDSSWEHVGSTTIDVSALKEEISEYVVDEIMDEVEASIPTTVTGWLNDHVNPESDVVIDDSLSISGAAADAAKVGELKSALNAVEDDYYAEIIAGETAYPYTVVQGNIARDGTFVDGVAYAMYSSVFTTAELVKLTVNAVRGRLYINNYSSSAGDKEHFVSATQLLQGNEITNNWNYPYFRISVSEYGQEQPTITETEFRTFITATKPLIATTRKGFIAPVGSGNINWGEANQIIRTDGEGGVIYTSSASQKWAGKKFLTFGDSITYYDNHSYGSSHKQYGQTAIGYQTWMQRMLGCTIVNEGISGYSMPEILPVLKSKSYLDVDAVTITSGANDYSRIQAHTETIGELLPIGSAFNESTFYGSVQSAIEYILSQNNTVKIYLLTPIKGWFNYGATVLPDTFAEALKDIGKLYSISVCDWYYESQINILTKPAYIGDLDDSTKFLHPNDAGYEMMANVLVPFLENH